jgi:hypothetical protein
MTDLLARVRQAQSTDPSPSRHALWGEVIEALEQASGWRDLALNNQAIAQHWQERGCIAEAAIATYVAKHDSGTHTAGDMQPLRQIVKGLSSD